jgi:hypothetical protein
MIKKLSIIGPVASGAAVLENKNMVEEQIIIQHRKLIGIGMEVFGVYHAANYCSEPKPKFFALKSISNFADGKKVININHMQHIPLLNFFIILLLMYCEISSLILCIIIHYHTKTKKLFSNELRNKPSFFIGQLQNSNELWNNKNGVMRVRGSVFLINYGISHFRSVIFHN